MGVRTIIGLALVVLLLFGTGAMFWSNPLLWKEDTFTFSPIPITRWSLDNEFFVTVQYVYVELQDMPLAERINKRTNLEVFIQNAVLKATNQTNVQFRFMVAGKFPTTIDYFASLGVPAHRHRPRILPDHLAWVEVETIPLSNTDLCPQGNALSRSMKTSQSDHSFIFLINDGVRGPFEAPPDAASDLYADARIPSWFVPFLSTFLSNEQVVIVGPTLSAEENIHVQSFALIMRAQSHVLLNEFAEVLQRSCVVDKIQGILSSEVGLSQHALMRGKALGALFPRHHNFTTWHKACMRHAQGGCPDLSAFDGKNPMVTFDGDPTAIVFVKYGGELWRQNLYSPRLQHSMKAMTRDALAFSNATY